MGRHYCYVIHDSKGCTYNGYTVDCVRRLRQHNAEIKGGAKYTTRRSIKSQDLNHWSYLFTITSDDATFDNHKALSLEWSIKNPTNRRTRPNRKPMGRIASLRQVFSNPKFINIMYQLYIHDSIYYDAICETLKDFENVQCIRIEQ